MRIFKKLGSRRARPKPEHGLKRIPARRPGLSSFNYFRGTPREFRKLNAGQIAGAFESAGFALPPGEVEKVTAQLKEKVSAVSDFMLKRKNRRWLEKARRDSIPGFRSWDLKGWTPIVAPSGRQISGFAYWEGGKAWVFDVNTSKGDITFRVAFQKDGRIAVYQQPATHGVYPSSSNKLPQKKVTSFDALKSILETGFKGTPDGAPFLPSNVDVLTSRRRLGWFNQSPEPGRMPEGGITGRDRFIIEMMAPHEHAVTSRISFVSAAEPSQILRVTIQLDGLASKEQISEKKAFYREEIQKRYGVPVSFVQAGKA
ncbi:MAG: hypothetical protein NT067_07455 [Candidatus Diapherotrites archaeon]|nr:hypothetical protein [Candidatus Diapherotrites archaeon]